MGPLARGKAPPDWDRLAQRSNALLWMEHWKQTETEGGVSAVLQGPLAYKVPEAGLGQPAKIQGSVPWTSSGP